MPNNILNFSFTFKEVRALFAWLVGSAILLGTLGTAHATAPGREGVVVEAAGNAWRFDPVVRAWSPLIQNQTIGPGDQLRTDTMSRMAVRIGSSTLWLDAQTEVNLAHIDGGAFAVRLITGEVALRLRDPQVARATRVQTREGVVTQPLEGLLRVGQGHRSTRVGALQGRAQFDSDPAAPLQRAWLREGEQAEFVWDEASRMDRSAPIQDSFSAWFNYRDQVESGVMPQNAGVYPVAEGVVQAADMQRFENRGATVVEMGRIWIPTPVVRGWEPHRRDVAPFPGPNHGHTVAPFDRDRGWKSPGQHQRPVVPVSPVQPAPNAFSVPRAVPPAMQQPVPTAPVVPRAPAFEERKDNPRHGKRDNLDREMRKKEIDPLR